MKNRMIVHIVYGGVIIQMQITGRYPIAKTASAAHDRDVHGNAQKTLKKAHSIQSARQTNSKITAIGPLHRRYFRTHMIKHKQHKYIIMTISTVMKF